MSTGKLADKLFNFLLGIAFLAAFGWVLYRISLWYNGAVSPDTRYNILLVLIGMGIASALVMAFQKDRGIVDRSFSLMTVYT